MNANDEPVYFCTKCRDEPAAWCPLWCDGRGEYRVIGSRPTWESDRQLTDCGRLKPHAPHPFVDRCECRDINPEIRKHRERMTNFRQRKDKEYAAR